MKKIEFKLKKLLEQNRLSEAEPLFDQLYKSYTTKKLGYDNLIAYAQLKAELGNYALAEFAASQAIDLQPNHVAAPKMLLKIYFDTKEHVKADRVAERLLESDPESSEFLSYTLLTKSQLSRISSDEALVIWEQLIARDPAYCKNWQAHHAVLGALLGDGRVSDAWDHIQKYDLEAVDTIWMHLSIPNYYVAAGDLDSAIEYYTRIIEGQDHPNMLRYWNRGLLRLANGDLEGGWSDYKKRWEWKEFPSPLRQLDLPKWSGESLYGRSVIISAEQGIGDQIMFGSLINHVIKMGPAKLRLEVQQKAVELFKLWYPEADVVAWQNNPTIDSELITQFDVHLAMGDLAIELLRDQQAIESIQRRLIRATDISGDYPQLAEKLKKFDFIVGLNWRSGAIDGSRISAYLSVNLAEKLIKSLPANVGFVVVQYSVSDEERQVLSAYENCFLPEADFYNDIVMNGRFCGICDIVVAAPTMLVPLSALFGTPVLTWCRTASWVDLGTKKYPWFKNVHRIYCSNNADKTTLANLILEKLMIALRLK